VRRAQDGKAGLPRLLLTPRGVVRTLDSPGHIEYTFAVFKTVLLYRS
jgi:hypothetical protein